MPTATSRGRYFRLNVEFGKVMGNADVQKALIAQGVEPTTSTPEAFGAMVRSETAKWQKVVRDAGIKPE